MANTWKTPLNTPLKSGWLIIVYENKRGKTKSSWSFYNLENNDWTLSNNKTKVIPITWCHVDYLPNLGEL